MTSRRGFLSILAAFGTAALSTSEALPGLLRRCRRPRAAVPCCCDAYQNRLAQVSGTNFEQARFGTLTGTLVWANGNSQREFNSAIKDAFAYFPEIDGGLIEWSGPPEAFKTRVVLIDDGGFQERTVAVSTQQGLAFQNVSAERLSIMVEDEWRWLEILPGQTLNMIGMAASPVPRVVLLSRDGGGSVCEVLLNANPLFTKSDAQGRFVISGIPAGRHKMLIFHSASQYLTQLKVQNATSANIVPHRNSLQISILDGANDLGVIEVRM